MISALKSVFSTSDKENRVLNGFRALAIIMILIFHFNGAIGYRGIFKDFNTLLNNAITNFNSAVDLFFILSGFLISGGLYKSWIKNRNECVRSFFIRRAIRIFPSYYFFLIISLIFLLFTISLLRSSPQTETNMTNLKHALDFREKFIFDFVYVTNIIKGAQPHTWALSTEVQFYLLFPLFGYLILFELKPAARVALLSGIYLLQLVFRVVVSFSNLKFISGIDLLYVLDSMRFDSIIVGIIIMDLYTNFKGFGANITGYRVVIVLLSGFAILTVAHLHSYVMPAFIGEHIKYNLNNIGYGLLVVAGLSGNNALTKILSFRFWTPIARVSYNMFLWQFLTPIISLNLFFDLNKMNMNYLNYFLLCLFYIACTFIFSIVIYCMTEYPFLRIRHKFQ